MAGYAPPDTLKPVAGNLWVIDGPAIRFRGAPIPARAVVARLENGDLWVHAPTTRLTPDLQAALGALGRVRHLIVPTLSAGGPLAPWLTAFPEARVWSAEGVGGAPEARTRILKAGGERPWRGQIAQILAEGRRSFREPVFFHIASESLIVSHLIHNIETAHLPVRARPMVWLAGTDHPHGGMPPVLKSRFRGCAGTLTDAVEAMLALNPERIILRHGRSFDCDGAARLRRVFRRLLRDREWERLLSAGGKAKAGRQG